ncbi:MAG: outer membrane lipoprotein carrier protein LolA [Bacteroidota bacterium]|nr:outer membrane lipoprotein carrier protein LolA [Bacteroidota bacterium]
MIKKLLFSVFLLTTITSYSQNTYIGKSDPEAKEILDGVSAKFKTYKTVVANFSLKIANSSGKVMGTKNGVVKMQGSKYRISVPGQEIYSDGTNIWTYDKSANEVQITQFDASANSITPQKMFTNFYDKDFLYKLNGETKKGNKTLQEIELTPVDKTKTFFKVLVDIDKNSKSIISTEIFQKTGDRYVYTITDLKPNLNLSDNLFAFNAKDYPKVEVIDLR